MGLGFITPDFNPYDGLFYPSNGNPISPKQYQNMNTWDQLWVLHDSFRKSFRKGDNCRKFDCIELTGISCLIGGSILLIGSLKVCAVAMPILLIITGLGTFFIEIIPREDDDFWKELGKMDAEYKKKREEEINIRRKLRKPVSKEEQEIHEEIMRNTLKGMQ